MKDFRIRFVELLAEKSKRERRMLTIADVEEATGIDRRRLYTFRDNNTPHIKPDEIVSLCDYFPCEVSELIYYVSPLAPGQDYVRVPQFALA